MKKSTKNNLKKMLIKNIKEYWKRYLIVTGIVIVAIVIAIITTSNKEEIDPYNPQLDPNYKGLQNNIGQYEQKFGTIQPIGGPAKGSTLPLTFTGGEA